VGNFGTFCECWKKFLAKLFWSLTLGFPISFILNFLNFQLPKTMSANKCDTDGIINALRELNDIKKVGVLLAVAIAVTAISMAATYVFTQAKGTEARIEDTNLAGYVGLGLSVLAAGGLAFSLYKDAQAAGRPFGASSVPRFQ